jgi:ammonium transporter, Amt family
VGGFCYWAFAFGLMYGRGQLTNGLFGAGDFFVSPKSDDPLASQILTYFFFQISFANTSVSIFSGATSERCRYNSYILLSFMITIVYGIGGGWIWGQHGWLKNIGVVEFSGSGPCHIIGGAAGEIFKPSTIFDWW